MYPRMKKFLEKEKMERKEKLILLSVEEEQIGEAHSFRRESEEELCSEMLIFI